MKNGKFALIIAVIGIMAVCIACDNGGGSTGPDPEIQAPATKDLSFGTGCKVTIKSDDKFFKADWDALCDKVVAALGRGYTAAPSDLMKTNIATFFGGRTVVVILSGSVTLKCEVKGDDHNTIYLKADGATIDGIAGVDLFSAIVAMLGNSGEKFELAKALPEKKAGSLRMAYMRESLAARRT
jgi:hypothetical protein